jgi:hypothetical protein
MDERVPHFDSGERRVRLPEPLGADRRAHIRYPICLDLRYTVQERRKPSATGNGRAVDLSSSGLRFTTDRPLESGKKVELAISWPLALDGGVQLQLVARGEIVWSKENEVAVHIQRHEFRTRGAGLKFA